MKAFFALILILILPATDLSAEVCHCVENVSTDFFYYQGGYIGRYFKIVKFEMIFCKNSEIVKRGGKNTQKLPCMNVNTKWE